jgi:hypothetical protein
VFKSAAVNVSGLSTAPAIFKLALGNACPSVQRSRFAAATQTT